MEDNKINQGHNEERFKPVQRMFNEDHREQSEVGKAAPSEVLNKPKKRKRKINHWKLASAVLAILLVLAVFTLNSGSSSPNGELSEGEAAAKTVSFINTNLLQGQAVAKLTSVEEDAGLYNLKLNIDGQVVDGYITKDGKYFFPQMISLEENPAEEQAAPAPTPTPAPEITKSDKPIIELFVMSHCPFGTQAEKGILPVIEGLGDKVDFEIKFVNYAMHGEKEVLEQMNQVCIQEEQNDKFFDYLVCFLDSDDGEKCLAEVEVDTMKMETCVAALDEEFKITELLADQATWNGGKFPQFPVHDAECKQYGIQGSPGLVVNGQSVSSGRSPAEYLATVCAAFNDVPAECDVELSTQSFSPGFGYEVSDTATTASCS